MLDIWYVILPCGPLPSWFKLVQMKVTGSRRWSDGAMLLGKLPGPVRPLNFDLSRPKAYCACVRCGWGLFGYFFLFSLSLSSGDGLIETEILS